MSAKFLKIEWCEFHFHLTSERKNQAKNLDVMKLFSNYPVRSA